MFVVVVVYSLLGLENGESELGAWSMGIYPFWRLWDFTLLHMWAFKRCWNLSVPL
jgi:hypothetical protein